MDATMSECKNPKDRSDKDCTCGGHNANNPKKNPNHHSTKARLNIRKERKAKKQTRGYVEAIKNSGYAGGVNEVSKEIDKDYEALEQELAEVKRAYPSIVDKIAFKQVEKKLRESLEELADLREWKADIETQHQLVMDEKCPSDERHCTCVPGLRLEVERLKKEQEEWDTETRQITNELREHLIKDGIIEADGYKLLESRLTEAKEEIEKLTMYNDNGEKKMCVTSGYCYGDLDHAVAEVESLKQKLAEARELIEGIYNGFQPGASSLEWVVKAKKWLEEG